MTMADPTAGASPWVVLKFGGTSVSSVANWKNIAGVLRDRLAEGLRPVVVHSALSGITDRLEQLLSLALGNQWQPVMEQIEQRHRDLARDLGVIPSPELEEQFKRLRQIAAGIALVGEVSERLRARVLAQGELMATRLGAAFLTSQGLDTQWVDARAVIKAEQRRNANMRSTYLSATCPYDPDPELQQRWSTPGTVWISQGFIGSDENGDTVLLGRGGSDTSASYFAAKLQARRLEIWTDVPGMFSANPRSVPTARLLRALEYDEAQEIASSGAKVLHPRCIMPVKQYGIPLYVYATQTPKLEGTVVTTHGGNVAAQVKAVTIKKNITLISMETVGMWHSVGFLADSFAVFKQHGLSVDLVSTSETSVTVSLDPAANSLDKSALDALVADLGKLCRVEVIGPCAAVSLVGRNIRAILHRLGEALELFEEQKIYLVTQAANDLNITFVIDEEHGDRLVARLHEIAIRKMTADRVLGPTWEELYGGADKVAVAARQWWQDRRSELLALGREHGAAFVYDREIAQDSRAVTQGAPGYRCSLLCDEGQLAPADPAGVREPGPRLRVRVARRSRARSCYVQGHRSQAHPVHAELRAARGIRMGGGAGHLGDARQPAPDQEMAGVVQRSRAVRSYRYRSGSWTSRQGAHRGRPLEVRRAAVRSRGTGTPGQGSGSQGHRTARAHRQRRVQRRQLAVGGRHADGADEAIHATSARSTSAAGSACRSVSVSKASCCRSSARRSLRSRLRIRSWRCGSSRAAISLQKPVCCWPRSRS